MNPTEQQVRDYLENEEHLCPLCGSIAVAVTPLEREGERAVSECTCGHCAGTWNEVWTLDTISDLQDPAQVQVKQKQRSFLEGLEAELDHDKILTARQVLRLWVTYCGQPKPEDAPSTDGLDLP